MIVPFTLGTYLYGRIHTDTSLYPSATLLSIGLAERTRVLESGSTAGLDGLRTDMENNVEPGEDHHKKARILA
jgi:hypothetical protein